MVSPVASRQCVPDKHPGVDLSPQSTCSSPGLSRLTYISMNESTGMSMSMSEQQKVSSINKPVQFLNSVGNTADQTFSLTLSDVCLYFNSV